VWLASSAASGQPRLSEERAAAPATLGIVPADHPAVAAGPHSALFAYRAAGDGSIHAYWTEQFGRSSTRAEVVLGVDGEAPRVAWNGTGYVVVWSSPSARSVQGVAFADAALGPPRAHFEIADARAPSLACTPAGCLVVFQRGAGRELHASRVSPDGVVDPASTLVATLPDDAPTRVATDGTDFLVAWRAGADRIGMRVVGAAALGETRSVDATAVTGFDLAYDGSAYRALWQSRVGVVTQRVDRSGAAVASSRLEVSSDGSDGSLAPPALTVRQGRAVVVWGSAVPADGGVDHSVWARILDARTAEEEASGATRRVVRLGTPTHSLGAAASEDILHVTYDDSPVDYPSQGGLSARWTRYYRDLSSTNSPVTQGVSFARPTQEEPRAVWNGTHWMLRWFERDRLGASAEGAHTILQSARFAADGTPEDGDAGSFTGLGIGRWSSPWTAWARAGFMGALVHDGQLFLVARPSTGGFIDGGAWETHVSLPSTARLALTSEPGERMGTSALVAWSTDAGELHAAHRASLYDGGDRDLSIVATGLRDATTPALASSSRRRLLAWIDASGAVRARPGDFTGALEAPFTVASDEHAGALALSALHDGFLLLWSALGGSQRLRAMRFDADGCPTDAQPLTLTNIAADATFAAAPLGAGWLAASSSPLQRTVTGFSVGRGGDAVALPAWPMHAPLHGLDLAEGPAGTALLTYALGDPSPGRSLVQMRTVEGVTVPIASPGPCVHHPPDAGVPQDAARPDVITEPLPDSGVRVAPRGRVVEACGCETVGVPSTRGAWVALAFAAVRARRRARARRTDAPV
jgi:hypothetical protein